MRAAFTAMRILSASLVAAALQDPLHAGCVFGAGVDSGENRNPRVMRKHRSWSAVAISRSVQARSARAVRVRDQALGTSLRHEVSLASYGPTPPACHIGSPTTPRPQ